MDYTRTRKNCVKQTDKQINYFICISKIYCWNTNKSYTTIISAFNKLFNSKKSY